MWITEINYKLEDKEKLMEIVENIFKRDNTFKYSFDENKPILRIYSDNYEKAKKRGGWCFYKVSPRLKNQLFWNVLKQND